MFTGIIEEKGTVKELRLSSGKSGRLTVTAGRVLEDTDIGDSICVSGVCQTVVAMGDGEFTVDVMPETLERSTLGDLRPGMPVNLERALRVDSRLGGHIVNGHVDDVGLVRGRRVVENAVLFDLEVVPELSRYIVPKGSIAVDGISLTVVDSRSGGFVVSIIPHTLERTTLEDAKAGTRVNLEVDILAKYVEALLAGNRERGTLADSLLEGGFISPGEL